MKSRCGLTVPFFPLVALLASSPVLASDVTVTLPAGDGFVIQDNTATVERLRIDEATGNVSRNGALFLHTTGSNSIYVGAGAGNPSSTGGDNTAIGAHALAANTTGGFNTALGVWSLYSNLGGVRNVAVGHSALSDNTTGGDNVAVGQEALFRSTSGNLNTAVGAWAMGTKVNTGSANSAFGAVALAQNESGTSNTALGYGAMDVHRNGDQNTAVGLFAMGHRIALASRNTAVGASSLSNDGVKYDNTAVGYFALKSNYSGNRNVAIGKNAGKDVYSGSDNIYLANVGAADESGQIRIGTVGTHTQAYVAGIYGNSVTNGAPVVVDSTGKLGTSGGTFAIGSSDIVNGSIIAEDLAVNAVTSTKLAVDAWGLKITNGAKFTVQDSAGTQRFGVDPANGNIYFGADLFIHQTGSGNTFVGAPAGNTATSGYGTNTALGKFSMDKILTGEKNSSVGWKAMTGAKYGNANTAMGQQALAGNESGSNNVAIGVEALKIATGSDNTALGFKAGWALNNGSNNIYIRNGGVDGENGTIRIGDFQSRAFIRGIRDTAVASGLPVVIDASGQLGTVGGTATNGNVALGSLALAGTTGSQNVAVGDGAGSANTTGSDNIYIKNGGLAGESGIIRIGTGGTHTATFIAGDTWVEHDMSAATVTIRGGADLAEPFDVTGVPDVEPGMLVAIDPEHPGALRLSDIPYDPTVAGVVSGAGGVQPGITLTQKDSLADGRHPVALSGRVYAWADASAGGIRPGDLLTTSSTPGHAMRATNRARSQGAILGKAMTPLPEGKGLVLVLVSLQ